MNNFENTIIKHDPGKEKTLLLAARKIVFESIKLPQQINEFTSNVLEKVGLKDNKIQIEDKTDLSGRDLSSKNLSEVKTTTMESIDFNTLTKWPPKEYLPLGFDPEKILENGKNPGLGIKDLHEEGIDGTGVVVAIIDDRINQHREYSNKIISYNEEGYVGEETYHGTAVSSLLVGETCGVAPGARLVYEASGYDGIIKEGYYARILKERAKGLRNILEKNKMAKTDGRIQDIVRVVNCSFSFALRPEDGHNSRGDSYSQEFVDLLREANDQEVIIVRCGRLGFEDGLYKEENYGFYVGGSSDKENPSSYKIADWIKHRNRKTIIIPSSHRTIALFKSDHDYEYSVDASHSWAAPYLSGLCALAIQVDPEIKKGTIEKLLIETATETDEGVAKVVNPKGFIKAVKENLALKKIRNELGSTEK